MGNDQRSTSGGGDNTSKDSAMLRAGTEIKVGDMPVTLASDVTVTGDSRHLESIRNREEQGKNPAASGR